jgi:hypothetical protein
MGLAGLGLAGTALPQPAADAADGETLYNGIRLPPVWPPRPKTITLEPMAVPYLASPPAVIPIDVGRQLFIDDFLISHMTLKRSWHQARYHADTPVLKPDKPWEKEKGDPTAMVFSDGVWYDPEERVFKMWYMSGYVGSTCYATSRGGIHWDKPRLDVRKGTNVVQPGSRDSTTVWLDHEDKDPRRRYKFFRVHRDGNSWVLSLYFSRDGIHWGDAVAKTVPVGDRTTVFFNPFRRVWVYSIRAGLGEFERIRRYWEHADALEGARFKEGEPHLWVNADRLDPRRDDLKVQPQLYNLDCVAYESVLLGLFSIWRGQPKDRAKPNEVCVGFSRDGFHWDRPDRRALLPVSENYGDWNWGNVQSAGGCCLVVGDELYFYVSGRTGIKGGPTSGVCATGLATLRRDGFASMDAGETAGTLTTRKLTFRGKYLFVNVSCSAGELRAEALDKDGQVIAPFTRANCAVIAADRTLQPVTWKGADDLSALAGKVIQFRFQLKNGRLYAFWVSPDKSAASHGYVAAGGPGFSTSTDTVGAKAQEK